MDAGSWTRGSMPAPLFATLRLSTNVRQTGFKRQRGYWRTLNDSCKPSVSNRDATLPSNESLVPRPKPNDQRNIPNARFPRAGLGRTIQRTAAGFTPAAYDTPTELAAIALLFPPPPSPREIGLPWLCEAKRYGEPWRLGFHARSTGWPRKSLRFRSD